MLIWLLHTEFMVPNAEKIIVDVLENDIGDVAIGGGGIAEAGAIMQIASVNEKKVDVVVDSSLVHVLDERHKVTLRRSVTFLDVLSEWVLSTKRKDRGGKRRRECDRREVVVSS